MKNAPWMISKLKMPSGRPNSDIDKYIERIYIINKAQVDTMIQRVNDITEGLRFGSGITVPPEQWLNRTVKDYLNTVKGSTVKDAIEAIGLGSDFNIREERELRGASKFIQQEGNWEKFKKEALKFGEINWNNLTYTGNSREFYYKDLLIILPRDSQYGEIEIIYR